MGEPAFFNDLVRVAREANPATPLQLAEALRRAAGPTISDATVLRVWDKFQEGEHLRGYAAGGEDFAARTDLGAPEAMAAWENATEEWRRGWSEGYDAAAARVPNLTDLEEVTRWLET